MKRPRNNDWPNASETPQDAEGPREPKLTGEVPDSRSRGGSGPETLDTDNKDAIRDGEARSNGLRTQPEEVPMGPR